MSQKLKKQGIGLAVCSLVLYIIGGIFTFGGLALIATMKYKDLYGLGEGRSIGILLLCVGLSLSIIGVLLMRVFRNR
jgi:hypothetical protein